MLKRELHLFVPALCKLCATLHELYILPSNRDMERHLLFAIRTLQRLCAKGALAESQFMASRVVHCLCRILAQEQSNPDLFISSEPDPVMQTPMSVKNKAPTLFFSGESDDESHRASKGGGGGGGAASPQRRSHRSPGRRSTALHTNSLHDGTPLSPVPVVNECIYMIVSLGHQLGGYVLTFNNLIETSLEGYPDHIVQVHLTYGPTTH
jgi:hypothetical protein